MSYKLTLSTLFLILISLACQNTINQEVTMQENPEFLYKVIDLDEWNNLSPKADIPKGPLDTNFIHLATSEQLPRIIEKFWKSKETKSLKLKTIELEKIGKLVFESNKPGGNKYYHLYTDSLIPQSALVGE